MAVVTWQHLHSRPNKYASCFSIFSTDQKTSNFGAIYFETKYKQLFSIYNFVYSRIKTSINQMFGVKMIAIAI